MLQQKLNAQLLQISALQARIEERRLGVHSSEFVDELQIAQEDIRQKKEVIEVVTQQVGINTNIPFSFKKKDI